MLRRLLRDFADVSSDARVATRSRPGKPTRLNARYHAALRLAELVLRATSVEHDGWNGGRERLPVRHAQLFEDFVTVALREAIEAPTAAASSGRRGTISTSPGACVLDPTSSGGSTAHPPQ